MNTVEGVLIHALAEELRVFLERANEKEIESLIKDFALYPYRYRLKEMALVNLLNNDFPQYVKYWDKYNKMTVMR